jgi:DNA modification methylase
VSNWELRLGDCLDPVTGLASLADKGVDAVVTDPPYGIGDDPLTASVGRKTNDWHPITDWDDKIDPRWAEEISRISGVVVWFGNWRKRHEVESMFSLPIRAEVIWAKDMHTTPAQPVASADERIWIFSKESIKPGEFSTSVWQSPVIPTWSRKHHKNEKPLALMEKALRVFSSPGDLVCDPFAGSGTTGVAAIRLGRRFIGWEKDPRYYEIARKRLENTREQLSLLEPRRKPKQESLL